MQSKKEYLKRPPNAFRLEPTFPRNSIKSPTVFMAATRNAFSTSITKASFAEVQKLVLLIAVAVYAFWEEENKTHFHSLLFKSCFLTSFPDCQYEKHIPLPFCSTNSTRP